MGGYHCRVKLLDVFVVFTTLLLAGLVQTADGELETKE